jgi:lysozyme
MSINNLTYSKSGLKLTEGFEGLRLQAYQDSVGVWTIGYGHTGGVYPGMAISQLQAEQFLLTDVQSAVHCVNQALNVVVTQDEFDSLVDFVFNVGSGNFVQSTLLKDLNDRNFADAAQQFLVWDKAGGQVLAGLMRRRAAESHHFQGPSAAAPTVVPGSQDQ